MEEDQESSFPLHKMRVCGIFKSLTWFVHILKEKDNLLSTIIIYIFNENSQIFL